MGNQLGFSQQVTNSPQDKSPDRTECSEQGSLPSNSADCESLLGDTNLEHSVESSRSRYADMSECFYCDIYGFVI